MNLGFTQSSEPGSTTINAAPNVSVKFSGPEDPRFKAVCEVLRVFVQEAPGRIRVRFLGATTLVSCKTAVSVETRMAFTGSSISEDEKLLQTLAPVDSKETLDQSSRWLLEGSNSWILSNADFTEWLQGSLSQLLWLHGDAGTGKTLAATFLIRELASVQEVRNNIIRQKGQPVATKNLLAYFFCQARDSRRRSATAILSNLLYQVLQQRPDLMGPFRDLHRQRANKAFVPSNIAVKDLWDVLQRTIQQRTVESIFVVIDALDELDQSRSDLLTLLQPYVGGIPEQRSSPPTKMNMEPSSKLRLLVTSRNYPDILESLSGAPTISMELNSNTADDIRRYVELSLSSLLIEDEGLKDEIKRKIIDKSHGNFLWARLAISELGQQSTGRKCLAVLDNLPSQLDTLYQHKLTEYHLPDNGDAMYLLMFMAVSYRPMTFPEVLVAANLAERSPSLSTLQKCIEATASLLTVSNDSMLFIHFTARDFIRDFMQKEQEGLIPSFHSDVAAACFKYISNPQVWTDSSKPLDYPVAFWIDHARWGMDKANIIDFSSPFFERNSSLRNQWFDLYWLARHADEVKPTGFTLMHIAAESGYYHFAEQLLDEHIWAGDVSARDSQGNVPLHWAAWRGHVKVVEVLLSLPGLDVDPLNFNEMTPLNFAASGGYVEIAEMLIHNGANVNSKARNATTVLHNAARNGHEELVRLLLKEGADIYAVDVDGNSAQRSAMLLEHKGIFNLLSEYESKRLYRAPLPYSQKVDGPFLGAIVDLLQPPSWRYYYKRISVDRMLSHESFDEIMGAFKGETTGTDVALQRSLRWLHLPANNMRWVEILMAKHYDAVNNPDAVGAILRPEIWADEQHEVKGSPVHGRFIKPGCQRIATTFTPQRNSLIGVAEGSGLMLIMPYLNWATEGERTKLNHIIEEVTNQPSLDVKEILAKVDRYEKLLWVYLYNEHPLHVRRTLDQFYYSTLRETETRDVDQVPYKYFHGQFPRSTMHPVLMVDQLWLWVLDDSTVITSFPQRWTEPRKNDLDLDSKTDVLDTIFRRLDVSAANITNASQLAALITNECSSLCFNVTLSQDGTLSFPKCYEIFIGLVADAETRLFKQFSREITRGTPGNEQPAPDNDDAEFEVHEEVFQIEKEVKQLELIKDVRDELSIISTLLEEQDSAISEAETLDSAYSKYKSSIALHKREIAQLDRRAEKVYVALKDLLDLKQKQANVAEARSQRHQAEQTTTQGKAILLFTIITIVFLPLSFMASFFALQIVDFPRLTLSFVLRYMLPISAAVSVPCIIIALNFDLFSDLERRLVSSLKSLWKPAVKEQSGPPPPIDTESSSPGKESSQGTLYSRSEGDPSLEELKVPPTRSSTSRSPIFRIKRRTKTTKEATV